MSSNPLLRYGAPKQIACTLGVSGEFPDYVSGLAYTGTVSIGGAQGETRVELVPPGTDASGTAFVPLANADFAAGASSWAVVNELSASTFSFQAGAGRTAAGFLRWAPTTGAPGSYLGDTIANTTLVQSSGGEVNLEAWVRCTAIGPQPGGEILDILLGVQIFEDAAGTIVRDPFSIGGSSSGSRRISGPIDWFPLRTRVNIPANTYYRLAFQCRAGTSGTVEFDDCQWDARGVPSGPPSTLGLPAGFTIDTVTSPDRVRVQWPATAAPGASTLPNLGMETGDVNWLKGAGWAITNVAPVDAGSWSAKYTGLGQSNIVHETLAPVTAGASITALCRVSKGNNRQDFAGGAVLLQWFDANTRIIGFNVGNVINTGSSAFQTSSVTATAPAGAAFVRLGASGSRDVKGRASDAVTVDAFTWNHTFSLGGTGAGGSNALTGAVALTFRVQDSVGCSAVATRTIGRSVATSATSLLNLNGTNGSTTFTDETGKAWTRTGTAAISTSQSKYGGASLLIPTGWSGISTTDTIPSIVPGIDFCIEFWLYAGPNTGDIRVVAKVGGVAGITGDNAVLFYKGSSTDGIISAQYGGVTTSSPSGFTDSSFVHIAFAVHHNGGGYNPRLFVDGVLVAGGGTPTSGNFPEQINFGSTSLWIGDAGTGRGMFGGFIDDFRLTVGSPVYTANFTPPGQLSL